LFYKENVRFKGKYKVSINRLLGKLVKFLELAIRGITDVGLRIEK
jgi:hypothetical protein